jgi:hypothetical protein
MSGAANGRKRTSRLVDRLSELGATLFARSRLALTSKTDVITPFGLSKPMKTVKKLSMLCIVAAVFSGCAAADFTAYSGLQQNWPTQPGGFLSMNYVIPAYIYSWPSHPYLILGYLDARTAPIRRRGVVAFAARRARRLGADAIIVMQPGQELAAAFSNDSAFSSGNVHKHRFTVTTTGTGYSAQGYSPPLVLGKAQVLAIKWRY